MLGGMVLVKVIIFEFGLIWNKFFVFWCLVEKKKLYKIIIYISYYGSIYNYQILVFFYVINYYFSLFTREVVFDIVFIWVYCLYCGYVVFSFLIFSYFSYNVIFFFIEDWGFIINVGDI